MKRLCADDFYNLKSPTGLTKGSIGDGRTQIKRETSEEGSRPWGKRIKPYGQTPKTGRTRHYEFTIERAISNSDGYIKDSLAINGQIPGPLIEADWGDVIEGENPYILNHGQITHQN